MEANDFQIMLMDVTFYTQHVLMLIFNLLNNKIKENKKTGYPFCDISVPSSHYTLAPRRSNAGPGS